MEIITRAEARARGLKMYFIGLCANGHCCERYVYGGCKQCTIDLSKKKHETEEYKKKARARAKTPEARRKNAERQAEYRRTHPEYKKKAQEQTRVRNLDRYRNDPSLKKRQKDWRLKHPEHCRKLSRIRYKRDMEYSQLMSRKAYYEQWYREHDGEFSDKQKKRYKEVLIRVKEIQIDKDMRPSSRWRELTLEDTSK